MAEVFDYAEGIPGSKKVRQTERVVALHKDVQRALDKYALRIYGKALENHASRRNTEGRSAGNSYITLEEGAVDRGINLVDPPRWRWTMNDEYREDPGAAWEIEFGHEASDGTWVEGKWILHDAAGLPREI